MALFGKKYTTIDRLSPLKFKCNLCIYKTRNRSDLRRHEKRHVDPKFSCDICNMPFNTRGHLGGHRRAFHLPESSRIADREHCRLYCNRCDYSSYNSSDMSKHKHKHEVNAYPCPLCNYPLGQEGTLVIHLKKYHSEYTYKASKDIVRGCRASESPHARDYPRSRQVARRHTDVSTSKRNEKGRDYVKHKHKTGDTLKHKGTFRNTFHEESQQVLPQTVIHPHRNSLKSKSKHTDRSPQGKSSGTRKGHENKRSLTIKVNCGKRETNYNFTDDRDRNVTQNSNTIGQTTSQNTETDHKPLAAKRDSTHEENNDEKRGFARIFSCSSCTFLTRDQTILERHSIRHDAANYECKHCKMPFLFKTNLDRHLNTKHSDSSFEYPVVNSPVVLRCESCVFVTYSYSQMADHKHQHGVDSVKTTSTEQHKDETFLDDDSNDTDFSLNDEDPDLLFSLDECTQIDEYIAKTDKESSDTTKYETGTQDTKTIHQDIKIKSGERGIERHSKYHRLSDNYNSNRVEHNHTAGQGLGVIEEYSCTVCDYVTLDKQFIRLHMTTHGFDHGVPVKKSKLKVHKETVLGYKTRIVSSRSDDNRVSMDDTRGLGPDPTYTDTRTDGNMAETGVNSKNNDTLEEVKMCAQVGSEKDSIECIVQKTCKDSESCCFVQSISKVNTMGDSPELSNNSLVSDSDLASDLIGRLTKEEFEETRSFYKREETASGEILYQCKICTTNGIFTSNLQLYNHFKTTHEQLRTLICSSCKYCCAPFPKLG